MKPDMALEIRLLKDDEYPQVVDFYNKAQNIGHKGQKTWRTLERFKWEFVDCPMGKAIYAVAIEKEGSTDKVVGVQCAIPFMFKSAKNEAVLTAKGEDSLLDISLFRKYRNRDILKEMYNFLFEECIKHNIKLIWGFNNIPSTLKRVGFDVPFFAKNAVMVLKPFTSYKYLSSLNSNNTGKDKFKIVALSIMSTIYGYKRIFISNHLKKYTCSDRTKENFELFCDAVPDNSKYYFLNQDSEFIKWRVIDNPTNIIYKTKQWFDTNGNLVAEIIYSYYNGLAYIEQMLFNNGLPDKIKLKFIKKIIEELVSVKSFIIRFAGFENTTISKHEIYLLRKAGFIFAKRGAAFVIKPLTGENTINPNELMLSRLYFQSY